VATHGLDTVNRVFVEQMGLTLEEVGVPFFELFVLAYFHVFKLSSTPKK
jgi:hypothetical protein